MAGNLNLFIIIGLALFIAGLVLPFIDIRIIESVGKPAETIGTVILFLSVGMFIVGVILTLFGFHRQRKKLSDVEIRS